MEQRRIDRVERPNPSGDTVGDVLTARAVVDERGVVTEWSEGARQLLGYPPAEIIGMSAARLVDEEVTAETLRQLPALSRWAGTVRLRQRDGHRVEARLLAHRRMGRDKGSDWLVVAPLTGTAAARRTRSSPSGASARRPAARWRRTTRICACAGPTAPRNVP